MPDTDPGGDFAPPDYSDSNRILFEDQFGDDEDMTLNFGFLWRIANRWSLGGVYREGPEFDLATVAGNIVGASAEQLARATVAGAGELLRRSDLQPAELRKNVTSPKGTTAAALDVLMSKGEMKDLFARAVAAAAKRSRELSS